METIPQKSRPETPTWTLIRDVGILQVKLIIDGFRDLVLVPASLIAGIISLAKSRDGRPGNQFYELVSAGKQSEQWINLFGALNNAPPEVFGKSHFGDADMDSIVTRIEDFVVDEYKRGGITSQARERIDKALDAMRRNTEA